MKYYFNRYKDSKIRRRFEEDWKKIGRRLEEDFQGNFVDDVALKILQLDGKRVI